VVPCGWTAPEGGAAGTPTIVEDDDLGRRFACGEGEAPVGPAEAESVADADDGSATGTPPGDLLLPPVSAIVTPTTAATSTAPVVTMRSTPRRNRISSSRACTAARRAEGRPCRPPVRVVWVAEATPA